MFHTFEFSKNEVDCGFLGLYVSDGYLSLQVNRPSVVFIDEIDALATRYICMCLYYEHCPLFVCPGMFTCLVEIFLRMSTLFDLKPNEVPAERVT